MLAAALFIAGLHLLAPAHDGAHDHSSATQVENDR